jgi:restriction system protein
MEELIAGVYGRGGFDRVILTPRSGDGGRDVIAEKTGWGSARFLARVKAYKPGHLVTAEQVRLLAGVVAADRAASKCILTTTSDFAQGIFKDASIQPLLPSRIELVNGIAQVTWRLDRKKPAPKYSDGFLNSGGEGVEHDHRLCESHENGVESRLAA